MIDDHSIRTPYDYIKYFDLWQEYRDWLEKDPQKDKLMSEQGSRTPWYYINYRWDKIKRGLGYFAPQPLVYKGSTNAIISKNMFWTLHPLENRFLSTRELLSLMGMPADFELISGNLQHVTQNVPVCTAKDMTEQVIKFINGELDITSSTFMKMNNLTQKVDWEEQSCVKLF
jgi:site-specific DNA-cytosine methylase